MDIGNRIKQLRQKNGLTQEELAIRCELSPGFISQVERDLTSPSIATLEAILIGLGEDLRDFFRPEPQQVIIAKKGDVCTKNFECLGYSIDWIIPNAQKLTMEPILVEIKPKGKSKLEIPHEGEEFGYVICGEVILVLNKREYQVKTGESFYFMPFKDHYLKNDTQDIAKVLWVSSPPNF
jgi:transcriptional regulator with XRE-family HTH domain